MTILAEGNSLKDGSNVMAKLAPSHSNGSMCLEREAHVCVDYFTHNILHLIYSQPGSHGCHPGRVQYGITDDRLFQDPA
jgi:hypothetical protein